MEGSGNNNEIVIRDKETIDHSDDSEHSHKSYDKIGNNGEQLKSLMTSNNNASSNDTGYGTSDSSKLVTNKNESTNNTTQNNGRIKRLFVCMGMGSPELPYSKFKPAFNSTRIEKTEGDHKRLEEAGGDHKEPEDSGGDHKQPEETGSYHNLPDETDDDHKQFEETGSDHKQLSGEDLEVESYGITVRIPSDHTDSVQLNNTESKLKITIFKRSNCINETSQRKMDEKSQSENVDHHLSVQKTVDMIDTEDQDESGWYKPRKVYIQ